MGFDYCYLATTLTDYMLSYLATWISCYLKLARVDRAIVTFGTYLPARVWWSIGFSLLSFVPPYLKCNCMVRYEFVRVVWNMCIACSFTSICVYFTTQYYTTVK